MGEILTLFDEHPLIAAAIGAALIGVVTTMALAIRALFQDSRARP
jgi:Flp pilus assembly pilin Flp